MSEICVYLIRHEEAEDGYDIPDAHRALTAKGRRRMRATGHLVSEQPGLIDFVYTSPLVRAVQTAEILVDAIGLDEPVLARGLIANPPSMDAIVDLICETPRKAQGIAIVGHEPTMGELAATLLGFTYPRGFKKGAVLALDFHRGHRHAKFRWLILGKGPTLYHDLEGHYD